jgi:hypothetical protein
MEEKQEKLGIGKVILYLLFSWGLVVLSVFNLYSDITEYLSSGAVSYAGKLEILNSFPPKLSLSIYGVLCLILLYFAVFVSKGIYKRNVSN